MQEPGGGPVALVYMTSTASMYTFSLESICKRIVIVSDPKTTVDFLERSFHDPRPTMPLRTPSHCHRLRFASWPAAGYTGYSCMIRIEANWAQLQTGSAG